MTNDYLTNVDYAIDDSPLWKLMEDNYNKYYLNFKGAKKPKIPKIIHQVWIGSELPMKYFRLIRSFIDQHPDWEYKLWTDSDVEAFGMVNKELFDAVENKGLKSDIFRYEIVHRYGGIYLDTDFKCIKPFDDLLYLDFFAGNGYTSYPYVNCGLFGAYPNHPLLAQVIKDMTPKINALPRPGRYGDVMAIMGADFFAKEVLAYMPQANEKIVIFPKNFFYPFPPELRHDADIQKNKDLTKVFTYIKDVTYCVHLWHTSWQWQTQIIEEGDEVEPYQLPPLPKIPRKGAKSSPISRRVSKIKYMRRRYGGRYPR